MKLRFGLAVLVVFCLLSLRPALASAQVAPNNQAAEASFNRGEDYWHNGDSEKAIADYTAAIALNPQYIQAYCRRAWAYETKDDHDKAIADCTAAIGINPKYAAAYRFRGRAYFMKGETSLAEADFARVKSLEPMVELALPQAPVASAQSRATPNAQQPQPAQTAPGEAVPQPAMDEKADAEHTKKAWEQIEDINIELAPLRGRDLVAFWEGVSTRHAKVSIDYVDSELRSLIQERIATARDMSALLMSYGEARQKIIQGVSDATDLGATIGKLADDPQKGEVGGAVLFGLIGNAVADSKLKELNDVYRPKYVSLLKRESQAKERHAELSKTLSRRYGVPFHQRSESRNSIKAVELYNSGCGWAGKREFTKAIADFNEAIRLYAPDDSKLIAQAYGNRGQCWSCAGNYDKAISDFDEAIKLDPKDAVAYSNRGLAWVAKGDDEKAVASFNEAIRLNPNNAIPYAARGFVHQRNGRQTEAEADFAAAKRLRDTGTK